MTTAGQCVCGQPAPTTTICTACTRQLQRALHTATGLASDLDHAIARQTRFTDTPHIRTHVSALPYNERASMAAATLRTVLMCWSFVVGTMPDVAIAAMAQHLAAHLPAIAVRPDADQALAQITSAVWAAQRAIDRPPSRIYAGPCPTCGTDLLGKPGSITITCRVCSSEHDVAQRQEWMRGQLDDMLGTATYLAQVLAALGYRTTPELIRKWASRGKLAPRPGGLYRAGDVITLATACDLRKPLAVTHHRATHARSAT